MNTWIVKRHGSNGANQSMTPVMVLGTVEADTMEQARTQAENIWTCYNNQHFSLKLLTGRTKKAEREEAETRDALRNGQKEWEW